MGLGVSAVRAVSLMMESANAKKTMFWVSNKKMTCLIHWLQKMVFNTENLTLKILYVYILMFVWVASFLLCSFQWRETSVGTFWKRLDVKHVMETLLHFLYQTAVVTGLYQYLSTKTHQSHFFSCFLGHLINLRKKTMLSAQNKFIWEW